MCHQQRSSILSVVCLTEYDVMFCQMFVVFCGKGCPKFFQNEEEIKFAVVTQFVMN